MFLNHFFCLEMVKGDPNHHPRTLNAPFRAARHPGVQNNKTGSFHVRSPVESTILEYKIKKMDRRCMLFRLCNVFNHNRLWLVD